jgi:2'-5' RNA ligase
VKDALIRSFLAIDLHSSMQIKLEEVISILRNRTKLPVHWVAGKNIHLTLKFLGESEPARLKRLENSLQSRMLTYEPFDIQIGELGVFPSINNPRIIWVGVQAPQILERLAREIEEIAFVQGYEREKRQFSPHLTLGRVSQSADRLQILLISEVLQKLQVAELGTVRVESIAMMKSVLTPAGPIYSPLSIMHFSC